MRTFILVLFWLLLLETVVKAVWIATGAYPRIVQVGTGTTEVVFGMGFVIWAAYLLWA